MNGGRWTAGLRPLVEQADRWRIRRDARGRAVAPFLERRKTPGYLVLVYHRVGGPHCPFFPGMPVRLFERQMELLASSHRVLPLEELMGRSRRGDVPPGAVSVTFDDGYADIAEHAAPVLKRYAIPATIFLATGPLDGHGPLWHDRVFSVFRRADGRSARIGERVYPMATIEDRRVALAAFLGGVRRQTPLDRELAIRELHEQMGLGADDPGLPPMLTWEKVRKLSDEGFGFGAHTVTHPILSNLNPEEAVREIRGSKDAIESRLQRPVRLFAYPNGGPEDFDAGTKAAVREAGFDGAATTVWGSNDEGTDPYELKRVRYWGESPLRGLARLVWYRIRG